MLKKMILTSAVLAVMAPVGAFAQSGGGGAAAGAATGAAGGAIIGGPVGAAVGGVTGAIVGGILGESQEPRFRQYVVQQDVPSYRIEREVRVGTTLPEQEVTLYEVPAEYGATGYRYTVVNEVPVLVEPGTRRIVQVIR
ncbi:DUF1236 domain-containing protein [Microvirga roseola]|uniref:DUF1236 domain-containing protein n=1 Tax=Microvirga roseola TaxID=2883126 RepID=UPI001E3770CA|nr:DUF1236 domain-containing protein [Microvirga roseola]